MTDKMWIDDITQTIWAPSEVKRWQKDLIKASAESGWAINQDGVLVGNRQNTSSYKKSPMRYPPLSSASKASDEAEAYIAPSLLQRETNITVSSDTYPPHPNSTKNVKIKIITDGLNNSWVKPEFKIKSKVWGSW
ncbi:MAG: hypothetical protein IBX56_20235 [Methylomicrobium sp.]|nr:hypothetical protein [Methylomicrobium sp.]